MGDLPVVKFFSEEEMILGGLPEPKPCPFCGSEAKPQQHSADKVEVVCTNYACRVGTPGIDAFPWDCDPSDEIGCWRNAVKEALERWNRRVGQ